MGFGSHGRSARNVRLEDVSSQDQVYDAPYGGRVALAAEVRVPTARYAGKSFGGNFGQRPALPRFIGSTACAFGATCGTCSAIR